MDAQQHCEILEDGLVESFKTLEMEEEKHYFQQDNDLKHTSKKAKKWFEDNDIQVISWPAQSPDLNPIEHFWKHLTHQLHHYETPFKGVHELWDRVSEEWNEISAEKCQNLIKSMPRRIQAVIRAIRGHILLWPSYFAGMQNELCKTIFYLTFPQTFLQT